MKSKLVMVAAAALSAVACAGKEIQHASVNERASHNQLYTVSAEPVVVDNQTGWVNIKVRIISEVGTDSVAFNMIVK